MGFERSVLICDLFELEDPLFAELFRGATYPWEVLSILGDFLSRTVREGLPGYTEYAEGVLVGEGVTVAPTATILPPAILGHGTEVRPGAYLRGNVLTGERCVIGNSTELKNSVLMHRVQVPHYNYVGDSVLGCGAHLGAGSICSNLKSGGGEVVVHADVDYSTGRRKLGAILGDGADVGCGCVLNPGTVIGRRTSVYPLVALRGVWGSDLIVKSAEGAVLREKTAK